MFSYELLVSLILGFISGLLGIWFCYTICKSKKDGDIIFKQDNVVITAMKKYYFHLLENYGRLKTIAFVLYMDSMWLFYLYYITFLIINVIGFKYTFNGISNLNKYIKNDLLLIVIGTIIINVIVYFIMNT